MRRIRLAELVPPNGWDERAADASDEVEEAEDKGDAIEKNSQVWRDLKESLAALSSWKCWYCETPWNRDDCAVDHFRPKNAVYEDARHPGYWWLAFDPTNYRFSCKYCNEVRVDSASGEAGGKGTRFPLLDGGSRATSSEDDLIEENAALLDPTIAGDPSKIAFTRDGGVVESIAEEDDPQEHSRAKISISVFHLHHSRLVRARAQVCDRVYELINRVDAAYVRWQRYRGTGDLRQNVARNAVGEAMSQIDGMLRPAEPYLAAVRCVLRAEQGPQRPWVQELLT